MNYYKLQTLRPPLSDPEMAQSRHDCESWSRGAIEPVAAVHCDVGRWSELSKLLSSFECVFASQ
jgi:hypothetical protein